MANQKKLKASQSVSGQVTLPGSKSITNRILLLSAISKGATTIKNTLSSDDTHYMIEALKKLQVELTQKIVATLLFKALAVVLKINLLKFF